MYISLWPPSAAEEWGETKQNYGLKVIKLQRSEISNYVKFKHEIRLINMRAKKNKNVVAFCENFREIIFV